MRFPNAAKGVKKIFTSEILTIAAYICLAVAAVLMVFAIAAGKAGDETGLSIAGGSILGVGILMIAWLVLAIIAFIMNLVGIINASHDEANFKSALLFLILGIAASCTSAAFASSNGLLSSLMYTLSTLMTLFVTIFVISGCVRLADSLNRGDVSTKGSNVLKLIIVIKIIELTVSLISTFMGGMVASVTAAVLFVVAIVLSIVQYFMYLSFLSKSKKMLAQDK